MAANLTIGTIWIDVSLSETHQLSAEVTEHPVEDGSAISDNIRPAPRVIQLEGLVTNHPIEMPLSHAGGVLASEDAGLIDVATSPGRRIPPMSREILGEPGDLSPIPFGGQAQAIAGALGGVLGVDTTLPRKRYAAEQYNEDRDGRTFFAVNALAFSEEFDRVGAVYQALVEVATKPALVRLVTGLDIYEDVALSDLSFDRSSETGRDALRFKATCKVLRIVNAQVVRVPEPLEQRGKPGASRGKQETQEWDPNSLSPTTQEQGRHSFGAAAWDALARAAG